MTNNYEIVYVKGDLTITATELVIEIIGATDTLTYNGDEQEVTGYEVKIPEGATIIEAEISGPSEAIAKGKDVDGGSNADLTYPMGLKDTDFSTTNTNYDVTFKVTDGWLKITPATLKITVKDQTYTYNGKPQGEGDTAYEDPAEIAEKVTVEGLKGSDALTSIVLDGQETAAGEYAGKITATNAAVGTATGNYEIEYVAGKLTISGAPITVTIKEQTFTYNGEAQGFDNETITENLDDYIEVTGLIEGEEVVSITIDGQETNAGTYAEKIVIKEVVISKTASPSVVPGIMRATSDPNDSTGNYDFDLEAGTLQIDKAKLTITAIDQTYKYNGKQQGEDNATYTEGFDAKVTVEGLQGSDVLTSITLDGRETAVGEYAEKIVPSGAEIGEATDNYEIEYVAGKLTIKKATDPTPGTGDNTNIKLWLAMTLTSAAGLGGMMWLAFRKKKREQN